jgi:hypothetical protein
MLRSVLKQIKTGNPSGQVYHLKDGHGESLRIGVLISPQLARLVLPGVKQTQYVQGLMVVCYDKHPLATALIETLQKMGSHYFHMVSTHTTSVFIGPDFLDRLSGLAIVSSGTAPS